MEIEGLDEAKLRTVPDGECLYSMPNGIEIVRRRKHEPIDLSRSSPEEVERRTGKIMGSKFLLGTTLKRIVEMTVDVLSENGAQIGDNTEYNTVYERTIGISRGKPVRGFRVLRCCNGKLAHGFPEDEIRL